MATNYIKVSPYVADKMGLTGCRATFPDGNYILWERDLAKADPDWAFHPDRTLAEIGGVMLNPWDAKLEMGRAAEDCVPLPVPESEVWRAPGADNGDTGEEEPSEPAVPEEPTEPTEPEVKEPEVTEEPEPTERTEPEEADAQPAETTEEDNEPLNAE